MKKEDKLYLRLLLAVLLLFIIGCKKVDKFTQFNLPYNDDIIIPKSTAISLPFNIFTPEIKSNSESQFAVNDTRKDLVESIFLTKLKLTLNQPETETFDFLKQVELSIDAEGLGEKLVAWSYDIPQNIGNELELVLTESDLQEYIKKDEFTFKIETVTRKALTQDHHLRIQSNFFVDAKILGQ